MKIRWFDRALMFLAGLILMALGVCSVLFAANVIAFPGLSMDKLFADPWQWTPVFILVGALLILIGVRIAFRSLWRQKIVRSRYYAVQSEDMGGVRISMQAIDHLIHKCLHSWPEILSTQVSISGQQDAVVIGLRATLRSDVRIPELITDVRSEIKEYVEDCSGVKVERVEVVIEATKDVDTAVAHHEMRSIDSRKTRAALPDGIAREDDVPVEQKETFEGAQDAAIAQYPSEPVPERDPIHISHSMGQTEALPVNDLAEELPVNDDMPELLPESGDTEEEPFTLSDSAFPFPEIDRDAMELRDELVELDGCVDEVEETDAAEDARDEDAEEDTYDAQEQ